MNFLLEPEDMMELCNAIGEYRYQYMSLLDNLYWMRAFHDDGTEKSAFCKPGNMEKFIKPQYEKTYGYMKEKELLSSIMGYSFMEPVVEDMVELGVDVWQGVLPQNDIPKLQQLAGRMTLMGGILDASIVDRADSTEEEIRREE